MAAGAISPPFLSQNGDKAWKNRALKAFDLQDFLRLFLRRQVFYIYTFNSVFYFSTQISDDTFYAICDYSSQNSNNPTQIGKLLLKSLVFYVIMYYE